MEPVSEETRTKALDAIRLFFQKPYNQHGKKRASAERKGWYEFHDWGHLVLRLHHLYYGTMLDNARASVIAQPLRKEFPNSRDWVERVNRKGAHERIREVFEQGLAQQEAAAAPAETTTGGTGVLASAGRAE
jgi:hypothetical protein